MSKTYLSINEKIQFETKGSTPKYRDNSSTIVLNQKCVRDGKLDYSLAQYISDEQSIAEEKYVKIGDVLLNSTGTGTAGRCAFVDYIPSDNKVTIDSHMLILRFGSINIARFFAYSLFKQERFIVDLLTGSSGQGELDREIVYNISFPFAEKNLSVFNIILNSINEKIELNNKINAELEKMSKTLYDYWFVQFDFSDENSKPYKSSGGKMVYNEELKREIPDGWESIQVDSLIKKESLPSKLLSTEYQSSGYIPIIDQSADFIAGYTNDKQYLIKIQEPKIIFGDHTRILKLINFNFARGADGTQVICSNNSRKPQHLFYHSLLKIDLSNYGYARHFKFLKDSMIILPEEKIANQFNEIVKSFYLTIKGNIFQNQELIKVRDWLLPMLMNGQVTFKEGA